VRLSTKSHNLHMRAALARGDSVAALRHFEAMSAAHPPQGLAPAAPAPTPAPSAAPSTGDAAATPAAAAPPVEAAVWASGAPGAWWLGEPARPDGHSYSIALTALRVTAPSDAPQAEHVERARRAAALARAAMAGGNGGGGGGGAGGQLSAPLVHSLITSCGGDVRTALALWRLPMVSGGAEAGLGTEAGARAEVGAETEVEAEVEAEARRAGLHALLRVCGVGGRADQALRVVTAARRQGNAPDASFWTAYVNGRAAAAQGAVGASVGAATTSYRRLFQSGYERLLQLECCPEQVGGKLGKVERIRIRF